MLNNYCNPLVSIRCMTFNHKPYIRQCLDGFVMQKTDFPFLAIVVDDASTDNEQEVLWGFINNELDAKTKQQDETDDYVKVIATHKTNCNCTFVFLFLKYNHYSIKKEKKTYLRPWEEKTKYIAICEGDDYWTDPLKLQKQVDFLESYPDFIICTHDYIRFFQEQGRFEERGINKNFLDKESSEESAYYEYSLDNFFKHWFTQPLTALYRNGDYLKTFPVDRYKNFRDDIFFYYILKEGKGALLKDVMGVYRINNSSSWSSKSNIQRWNDSINNAYNIYLVEGDERTILKMEILEKKIVNDYLRSNHFMSVAHEICKYRKMVPHKQYLSFVHTIKTMVLTLIRQRIYRLTH